MASKFGLDVLLFELSFMMDVTIKIVECTVQKVRLK